MDQKVPQKFLDRLAAAEGEVSKARDGSDRYELADALKKLANVQRRVPAFRDDANKTYSEIAAIYRELNEPLEAAWAIRHIGINHEYAERLIDAEACYDESLEIFRQHATENSLNYANTVRYPAVIKNRLGKRDESKKLWDEAYERYDSMNLPVAVAEACAWLTIFALEDGDMQSARKWFEKAESAAAAARDGDTDKFIDEVRARLSAAELLQPEDLR